jgi:hypothetical protein
MRSRRSGVNPLEDALSQRHFGAMGEKDRAREERLAAALRENLRRRKVQSRQLSKPDEREND